MRLLSRGAAHPSETRLFGTPASPAARDTFRAHVKLHPLRDGITQVLTDFPVLLQTRLERKSSYKRLDSHRTIYTEWGWRWVRVHLGGLAAPCAVAAMVAVIVILVLLCLFFRKSRADAGNHIFEQDATTCDQSVSNPAKERCNIYQRRPNALLPVLCPELVLPKSESRLLVPITSLADLHKFGGPIDIIGALGIPLFHIAIEQAAELRLLKISMSAEWDVLHARIGPMEDERALYGWIPGTSAWVAPITLSDGSTWGSFQRGATGFEVCRSGNDNAGLILTDITDGENVVMSVRASTGETVGTVELGQGPCPGAESPGALMIRADPGVDGALITSAAVVMVLTSPALMTRVCSSSKRNVAV